jgi:hypothetical protein
MITLPLVKQNRTCVIQCRLYGSSSRTGLLPEPGRPCHLRSRARGPPSLFIPPSPSSPCWHTPSSTASHYPQPLAIPTTTEWAMLFDSATLG